MPETTASGILTKVGKDWNIPILTLILDEQEIEGRIRNAPGGLCGDAGMEKKGRIGIPRALMFYRYLPFWQSFLEALGWEVIVSDGVGKKEKIVYFEDSCLPMKLLVTHASQSGRQGGSSFYPEASQPSSETYPVPKIPGGAGYRPACH